MAKKIPTPPSVKNLEGNESNDLWEVYTGHGGGFKAHIQAETAKEAIEKFESKYRQEWINKPYSVYSVIYLGTLTK